MTHAFTSTAQIERPIGEVWATLTDWDGVSRWMADVRRIAPVGDGPVREGIEVALFAEGIERRATVARWQPPHELVLVAEQPGVTATYAYRVTSIDEATTRVSLEASVVTRGWRRVLGPLIRGAMRHVDSTQMQAFAKAVLASEAGARAQP